MTMTRHRKLSRHFRIKNGDRIQINCPQVDKYHLRLGTIIQTYRWRGFCKVQFDVGNEILSVAVTYLKKYDP